MKQLCKLMMLFIFGVNFAFADTKISFLTLSDIHLSIDQKNAMQIMPKEYDGNNDMDLKTFESLMQALKENISSTKGIEKPAFVLYLGDMVGHQSLLSINRMNFVKENELAVFKVMQATFQQTPIINVFGNNDSPQENYQAFNYQKVSPYTIAMQAGFKNGFLSTGILCQSPVNQKQVMPCLLAQNKEAGYFSVLLKPHLRLIALNSVMFSPDHTAQKSEVDAQLIFLKQQLSAAKKNSQSVLIAMHIPVGKNVYDDSIFWQEKIKNEFLRLINTYAPIIKGVLVGHTHMDEFKIIKLKSGELGEYFTAGLSTSHGNMPSLKSYLLNNKNGVWSIKDYISYRFQKQAKEYHISEYYHFAKTYCQQATDNINNCLTGITFNEILKRFTLGNPNYPDYDAKGSADTFYVN